MPEIRCPNCGTSFQMGDDSNHPLSQPRDGIHYLVPETIRNENCSAQDRVNARLELLKAAGVNVDRMRELMNSSDSSFRDIFAADDPIFNELNEGGFIRNPELFRRWITAQTWGLIKDTYGWTYAVRKRYDIVYVFNQTKRELALLCKLSNRCPNDRRFKFFTLYDLKRIFADLVRWANNWCFRNASKDEITQKIMSASDYNKLYEIINSQRFGFNRRIPHKPREWLNCFKGAGAYYTLQNLIRTHELVLPGCSNMDESLDKVETLFNDIIGYEPSFRRWDIMLSLLTKAVKETNFELRY